MQVRMPYPTTRGFTLLELLIALAIFALVSVMAYSGLETVIATRDATRAHSDRLTALQRSFALLHQDLSQTVARPIRDRFGDPLPPMREQTGQLEWTRGGQLNPLSAPRSALTRVGYELRDGTLTRTQWQALDQPFEPVQRETALLENVSELGFRYLDSSRQWVDTWPPADPNAPPLPRAIEVRLEVDGIGAISRLFLLPF